MKMIRTQNDIEKLMEDHILPSYLISSIKQEFISLMKEIAEESDPVLFQLPIYKAIILLEPGENMFGTDGMAG
jgi:hypothetical protein